MHYRLLGATGLKVSILGMGSSPFRYGPPSVCAQLLQQAIEMGITYYDTARSYLHGEEAIANLPPHARQSLVVATKTGARGGMKCLQDLQRSLRTMKRDWIDVWMAHMIQTEMEYELCTKLGGFCDIAAAARQAGLVRATGASFHAPTGVILRAIQERAFDVVMFQMNLIGRETVFGSSIASYRETILPVASVHKVGVVVMKVLAGGELRHGAPNLGFTTNSAVDRNEIGGAVRYATMHPDIATAVVGMASTEELIYNTMAVEGVDDSYQEQFWEWSHRAQEIAQGECLRCGACLEACPKGIEIPKIFRLYDQLRFFGMETAARFKYAALETNGSDCDMCKTCQEVCPVNFDIGEALSHAHTALSVMRKQVKDIAL